MDEHREHGRAHAGAGSPAGRRTATMVEHDDAPRDRPDHDGHDHAGTAGHGDHHAHAAANRDHAGHAGHGGDHAAMFRTRFWWSLLLTIPVVATSHMIMDWFGYELDFYVAGWSDDRLLAVAGGVESDSEHPLARAIVRAATERDQVATASDFRSITGRGVEAVVDGISYAVGGPALLRERGLDVPDELRDEVVAWEARGAAVLHLVSPDGIVGALRLEDEVRPEAREAVTRLQRMGKQVVMITGDARPVAETVGRDLGVDEVFAEVLPEDKDAKVAELQARGLRVAMVGDGVNDAPALARADVGIAIGAGTDVAIESAGLVLASSDPRAVVSIVRLANASWIKSAQNLVWAAGYNIVAIPLAAGVLAWAGVDLAPAIGAMLMSASTIVVALNAQLLRRVDLQPAAAT